MTNILALARPDIIALKADQPSTALDEPPNAPKPPKAITRRVAHRCGVTAFQAACDIPIPCSKMSGRPAPDSL